MKTAYGQSYSVNRVIPSRTLIVPALEGAFALRASFFLFGLSAEYAIWQQFTDPKNINDSNLQGKMFSVMPMAGIDAGAIRLLLRYFPLLSTYDLSRPSRAGETQSYLSANQFGLQLHFRGNGRSFFGLEFAKTEYAKREASGAEYSLAAGSEMEFKTFGVIYGFAF